MQFRTAVPLFYFAPGARTRAFAIKPLELSVVAQCDTGLSFYGSGIHQTENQGIARAWSARAIASRSCCRTILIPTRWRARWRCARCSGATSRPRRSSRSSRSRGPENRTMVHLLEIEIQPADHRGPARVRQDCDGRRAAAVLRRENSARRYRDRSSSRLSRRRRSVRGRAHQVRRDRDYHDRVPGHAPTRKSASGWRPRCSTESAATRWHCRAA